jgi:hypothetical protein
MKTMTRRITQEKKTQTMINQRKKLLLSPPQMAKKILPQKP